MRTRQKRSSVPTLSDSFLSVTWRPILHDAEVEFYLFTLKRFVMVTFSLLCNWYRQFHLKYVSIWWISNDEKESIYDYG
jgi:hypothetical protein